MCVPDPGSKEDRRVLFYVLHVTVASQADIEACGDPRICLVGSLADDAETIEAAKKFNVPIVTSETGQDYVSDSVFCTYYILSDFETSVFEELDKAGVRLLGKPALIEQSVNGVLVYTRRPVFCHVIKDSVLVFTGFRKKNEVSRLLKLVHYMGGSVKNEIKENVTHLLAYSATGEKYQYANTFNIPIMGEDWVRAAWAHRDEVGARASSKAMNKYKLKVFQNLRIVLVGFTEEDRSQMEDLVHQNGGFITPLEDPSATHVVLEDQSVTEKPPDCPPKAHVVKAEWFWTSIQMEAPPSETLHLFEQMNSSTMLSPRPMFSSPSTPGSRSRRRKRLRETVQHLAQDDSSSALPSAPASSKRRSSVGDLAYLSADGSFLDDTASTPNRLAGPAGSGEQTPLSPPPVDLRQLTARQRVFHELVKTECNYVNILDAIEKSTELEKAYPPFINFFENMKEMLQKISSERPRFHAFLKIAQNKPECGRQNLQELLIRPVQRLPSMSLLIGGKYYILKHTEKTSPDHLALEQALDKIKSVMTFINDDKRKTEAKLKLFEIHNDIEMCPPNLVASHRMHMSKVDVAELSDSCSGRGDTLTLFLFNDVLEICKKKSKYNSIKSPSRANLHALKSIKTYKHLEMMNLAHIKRIVDIRETEDCHNVFALIIRSNQELKERLFTFTLMQDDVSFLDFHIYRFATRTGRKVSRAFSFNKSPSKLKRAVSTVMSPFGTLPQQASMRGATSVNNLADLSLSGTPPTGGFAHPMATPTSRRRTLKHNAGVSCQRSLTLDPSLMSHGNRAVESLQKTFDCDNFTASSSNNPRTTLTTLTPTATFLTHPPKVGRPPSSYIAGARDFLVTRCSPSRYINSRPPCSTPHLTTTFSPRVVASALHVGLCLTSATSQCKSGCCEGRWWAPENGKREGERACSVDEGAAKRAHTPQYLYLTSSPSSSYPIKNFFSLTRSNPKEGRLRRCSSQKGAPTRYFALYFSMSCLNCSKASLASEVSGGCSLSLFSWYKMCNYL
ncbi:Protein ECT2 [Chionoecetes opilio]|uniref:Protein ECT2 n=1 Tax=Chionoecetes opilio TaxID=41210 RepID=A0A8J5C965_CHIOP|nr:Protein ECT2 [Chionoecetes opilio]